MNDKADLLPAVYDELRRLASAKLASESPGHTLDATALVHEAYLKLQGSAEFQSRSHFFRSAAVAMQRILVDHARAKKAAKRGGAMLAVTFDAADRLPFADPDTLLDLDAAMERLATEAPDAADFARLRLFAGMGNEEAGEALGLSRATAFRTWAYAKAWLTDALSAREE